ncbi:hypothetical protein HIM_08809 [Hirsutella minnesotensis 3608]|uniref:Uncharacterized protein n=1 Tax=Hirsutella minnesotensis 3608 TaxID=1043627 RepID=A0A0F8A3G5_9HYPO|nr:hypothetical protein HIM_08809 [Hirsutella minnesotensis 3608]
MPVVRAAAAKLAPPIYRAIFQAVAAARPRQKIEKMAYVPGSSETVVISMMANLGLKEYDSIWAYEKGADIWPLWATWTASRTGKWPPRPQVPNGICDAEQPTRMFLGTLVASYLRSGPFAGGLVCHERLVPWVLIARSCMPVKTLTDLLTVAIGQCHAQCGPGNDDSVGSGAAASLRLAISQKGGWEWLQTLQGKGVALRGAAPTAAYALWKCCCGSHACGGSVVNNIYQPHELDGQFAMEMEGSEARMIGNWERIVQQWLAHSPGGEEIGPGYWKEWMDAVILALEEPGHTLSFCQNCYMVECRQEGHPGPCTDCGTQSSILY